jgi:hypothetical protein
MAAAAQARRAIANRNRPTATTVIASTVTTITNPAPVVIEVGRYTVVVVKSGDAGAIGARRRAR